MIDDRFRKVMQSNLGCAVIIAGSDTDREHIDQIVDSLRHYTIPHEVRICSAHKQPTELEEIITEYNEIDGSLVFITIAGGTDGLSGTVSYHALYPVISCPPDHLNLSCINNPPGSSNAYIANPKNVGKFIAQVYAGVNPLYVTLLTDECDEKERRLKDADREFRDEYRQEGV